MPQNPASQRYYGKIGGLGSYDPMFQFNLDNPAERVTPAYNSAGQSLAAMTKNIDDGTGKTLGGAMTAGVSGWASGIGLASTMTGGAALGTAQAVSTAGAAGLGLMSNPLGWIIGGGMALAYLFS